MPHNITRGTSMITIIEAIRSLNPNAGVQVGNNDIDDITWLDTLIH